MKYEPHVHGLADENGIIFDISIFEEHDLDFIKEVNALLNASNHFCNLETTNPEVRFNIGGRVINDTYYIPQPFPSWSFNMDLLEWEAPIAKPNDGKEYVWNESVMLWEEVKPQEG